jgi:hypothetical protein
LDPLTLTLSRRERGLLKGRARWLGVVETPLVPASVGWLLEGLLSLREEQGEGMELIRFL